MYRPTSGSNNFGTTTRGGATGGRGNDLTGGGGGRASQGTGEPMPPDWKWWYNIFGNKWEAEYSKYQNDYNMWAWDQQNQYNSPENMMDLWNQAGLNPNLAYSQGTLGNSPTPKMGDRPQMSNRGADLVGKVANVIPGIQKLQHVGKVIDNVQSVTDKNRIETQMKGVEILGKNIQNKQDRLNYRKSKELFAQELERYSLDSENVRLNNTLLNIQQSLAGKKLTEADLDIAYKRFRNELWENAKINMDEFAVLRLFAGQLQNANVTAPIKEWTKKTIKDIQGGATDIGRALKNKPRYRPGSDWRDQRTNEGITNRLQRQHDKSKKKSKPTTWEQIVRFMGTAK